MNERIKELIKQATTIEEHKWGVSYDNFDKEKFAELIVKECLDIAQDRAAFDGFPPNDVNHIIDEIKEHFGVEE
jgi:hypothetical protein